MSDEGVTLTELETERLIEMSDRDHPLHLNWGIGTVTLDPSCEWAIDAVAEMRQAATGGAS